jgi:hypothetical protein
MGLYFAAVFPYRHIYRCKYGLRASYIYVSFIAYLSLRLHHVFHYSKRINVDNFCGKFFPVLALKTCRGTEGYRQPLSAFVNLFTAFHCLRNNYMKFLTFTI